MTDERLRELVRAALPPSRNDRPTQDMWPRVASRLEQRPRWSYLDLGLAAAAATLLAAFPDWFWLLAYHL
jgi:hypothetical protein